MASTRNTWQKKLITKQKQWVLKRVLGNEVGVMTYCAKAKSATARRLDRETINDKPIATLGTVKDKDPLPRLEGWKPKPFGKRGR